MLTPCSKLPCVVPSARRSLYMLKLTKTGAGSTFSRAPADNICDEGLACAFAALLILRRRENRPEPAPLREGSDPKLEHISLVMCSCSERFVFPEHLFSFPEYQISRLGV